MCDPGLRTVNTEAECGSDKDSYYYSPWRAPGSAPVLDSCGMAGGAPSWGHHGAQYRTSPNAKQGDKGSFSLPQNVSGFGSIDNNTERLVLARILSLDGWSQGACIMVYHC